MKTDQDMRDQVSAALGIDAADYDIPAIVDTIQARYGTVDIDNVPGADFWEIVRMHVA